MGRLRFATSFRISDLRDRDGRCVSFVSDKAGRDVPGGSEACRSTLGDLADRVELLVGNSGCRIGHGASQPGIEEPAAFGSCLAVERAMDLDNPLYGPLEFMCRTIGEDGTPGGVDGRFATCLENSQFTLPDSLHSFSAGASVGIDTPARRFRGIANASMRLGERRRISAESLAALRRDRQLASSDGRLAGSGECSPLSDMSAVPFC